ncbi:AraC family transcriptional regulator [Murimonas intestini]
MAWHISYFYRQFKKNCGMTPQQYRDRYQNVK